MLYVTVQNEKEDEVVQDEKKQDVNVLYGAELQALALYGMVLGQACCGPQAG